MKLGIVSCAHMHANAYVEALKEFENVELVGIAEEDEKLGREFAKQYDLDYYKDYREFIKEDMDAVIICSENIKHCEMAVYAAEHKRHVIVEKPIATTIEDAQKMIDACNENGVKLMVTFPVRYSPAVLRAKEIIDSGKIGKVVAINSTNRGAMPGGWFVEKELSGGGCVIDHTVHVMDIINMIFRTDIKEVYAKADTLLHPELDVEDVGILSMELENGIYATLDTSWSRPMAFPTWGDLRIQIIGEKGTLDVDTGKQGGILYSEENDKSVLVPWGDDHNYLMIRDFIDCLENDRPSPVTGEDGLFALEVALMAYESIEKNEVVTKK